MKKTPGKLPSAYPFPRLLPLLLTLLLTTGCQSYHSKPLNSRTVAQALATPSWHKLRVAVQATSLIQLPKTMLSPSQGLTPNRAAALALILNPSLRAFRDLHGEASAQLLQAGILTNPQLSADTNFVTGGFRTNTFNAYGVGVSWNIRQLIDRQARISAARYQVKQVDLVVAWREWQIAQAARLAVYAMAAAKTQLREALRSQSELGKVYTVARRASKLGLVTLFDLGLALHASQQAQALVLASQQSLAESQVALAQAMGLPAGTTFTLSPSVRLPVTCRLPSVVLLEKKVERRRLDLLALHMGYQSQQERLRAAVLRQFPKVGIGFVQASDANNVHTTGFGVTINLPIFDRNQGRIAQARATRQAIYDDYIARVFDARADIGAAAVNIRALRRRISQAQSGARQYKLLAQRERRGLRTRNLDIGVYAAAVAQAEQARIQLVKLRYQLARNLIALELASGDALAKPPMRPVAAAAYGETR